MNVCPAPPVVPAPHFEKHLFTGQERNMVWVFVVVVFAILKNGAEFGMMSFDYGDVRPCVLYYVALGPHHHHRQPLKFNDKCLP